MMNRVVIALGSNIEPRAHTAAAIELLGEIFSVVEQSRFVFTEPAGFKDQPDFLNGVVLVETAYGMADIVTELKSIEQKLGRRRTGRKDGPRRIDLDLVLFNDRVVDQDVYERDFLRRSIREVLPDCKLDS